MKLKEIYKENLGRKYRNVIDTKGNNVQINSSPIKIFKEHKCYVVDSNLKNQIFLKFFKEEIFPDKERLKDLINVFTIETVDHNRAFGKYFKENYDKYQTFNEYFESYKQNELQDKIDLHQWIEDGIEMALNKEVIYTIKGELVKSKGEALIANFLFRNNIDYEYEKIYAYPIL